MCKMALTSRSSMNVGSSFPVGTGAERSRTQTWLSGYQSPGAQPATPVIGISPAKLEAVRTIESEIVKKIFLMIILLYLVGFDA